MSKERARRRAEREAFATAERERRDRDRRRRERRLAVLSALGRPFTAPVAAFARRRRPDSALRRQRARQDLLLAAALVAGNGIFWLAEPSWRYRGVICVASVLVWPLLVVLVFDRRRST